LCGFGALHLNKRRKYLRPYFSGFWRAFNVTRLTLKAANMAVFGALQSDPPHVEGLRATASKCDVNFSSIVSAFAELHAAAVSLYFRGRAIGSKCIS
jgi:hypothetical protein